jgi:hypothetical protein
MGLTSHGEVATRRIDFQMGARLSRYVQPSASITRKRTSAKDLHPLCRWAYLAVRGEATEHIASPLVEASIFPEAVIQVDSDEVVGLGENETETRERGRILDELTSLFKARPMSRIHRACALPIDLIRDLRAFTVALFESPGDPLPAALH